MNERIAPLAPAALGLLAHDLRASIAVILGALDEADRALEPRESAARPFLQMAARGAMRSLQIAERLQQAAELETEPPPPVLSNPADAAGSDR